MRQNPAICIIGDKDVESDLRFLEKAKEKFPNSNVFFVPLSGIRIKLDDTGGAILYRSTNIKKFDIIIPRILQKDAFFAYQLLSLLPQETYVTIRPAAYLITQSRFFLLNYLQKEGVPALTAHMAKTPSAASRILDEVHFPISLRIPEAETVMIARNSKEAKTQIDTLERLHKSILIEQSIQKRVYRLLVSGNEVVQSTIKTVVEGDPLYTKGRIKPFKPSAEMRELALSAMKALNSDIGRVDLGHRGGKLIVVNVVLKPSLIELSRESNTTINKMLDQIMASYKTYKDRPAFVKLFEGFASTVKDIFEK